MSLTKNEILKLIVGLQNSSGGGGSIAWGGITGNITSQTDLQGALDVKAPIASPAFTGTPTAPTPATTDNSNKIATTEFVKNYFNTIEPVTVGSTGATFLTLDAAYIAGYRNFYVISNTTQTNFTFLENVKIKIKANATLAFTPNSAAIISSAATSGNVLLVIESEEGGKITSTSNSSGSAFIRNSPTTSTLSVYLLGNVNFDFSASTIRLDIVNTNSRILNFTQEGVLTVQTPNNLACGFVLSQITLTGFFNAEYIIFQGLGTTSGFLVLNNLNDVFINKIVFKGTTSPTFRLMTLTNCNSVINQILYNLDTAQDSGLGISGTINNITNISNGNINILTNNDATLLQNANIASGVLNINNKNTFTGFNITSSNQPINITSSTLFTDCRFGSARATSVGSLVENQNPLRLFVSSFTGDDALNNGTFNYPYATIATAITNSINNSVIRIAGIFTEDVIFNANSNQTLGGESVPYDPLTTINGQIQIAGTATQVFLSNLTVSNNASTPITVSSIDGLQGLENVNVITTQATAILINYATLATTAKVLCSYCDFSNTTGIVNLANITGGGTATIRFQSCVKPNIFIGTGWTVELIDTELGTITGNTNAIRIIQGTYPPFRFSLTKAFSPSVTVNNGTSYNLFTLVNAGDIAGGATTNMEYVPSKFGFQNTNLALLFPPFRNYTDYKIRVQLQGTITGASGADRQFNIELRRGADNSLVLADYVVKIDGNDLTGLTRLYTSFVNGLSDPFITGGLRIVLNNTSGTSITLTGFSLLIQGISTNFIQ